MKIEFYVKNEKYRLSDKWTKEFDCSSIDDDEIIAYAEACRQIQADLWMTKGCYLEYPDKNTFKTHEEWLRASDFVEDDFLNNCQVKYYEVKNDR